jgi:hypothetical protein
MERLSVKGLSVVGLWRAALLGTLKDMLGLSYNNQLMHQYL